MIDIKMIEERIAALRAGTRYARARIVERGISTANAVIKAGEHRYQKFLNLSEKAEKIQKAENAANAETLAKEKPAEDIKAE